MIAAAAPRPLAAQAALEVVPRAIPFDVSLTRGEPAAATFDVRSSGEDEAVFGTLQFTYGESSPEADPKSPKPELVYPKGITLQKGQVTSIGILFPAYEAVGEYRGELYAKGARAGDPQTLLLAFPVRVLERTGPTLAKGIAGWVALSLATLVLLLPLVFADRKEGRTGRRRRSFFLTPVDVTRGEIPRYSISRFQVWLWTAVILFSFTYIFFTRGANIEIPGTLLGLMGISVGSIVTATTIAVRNQDRQRAISPGARTASRLRPEDQNWLASMLSENGSPSAMRLQMFAWTISMAVFFVWRAVTTATLWDIPPSLLALMGVSHGGYLIDKGVGKDKQPPAGEEHTDRAIEASVGTRGEAA